MENPDRIVFCDAEFVDNQEIIELSIWNLNEKEIFHDYFKPEFAETWPLSMRIHGIRPKDVCKKRFFSRSAKKIQDIFDNADFIVGFAIDGDIDHLDAQGIKGLYDKDIIDIKDMFWVSHGISDEIDYNSRPGLEKTAQTLDISFGEKGAHSASEDALVTLKCFKKIASLFNENVNHSPTISEICRSISIFKDRFKVEKELFDRSHAKGYVNIISPQSGIYKVTYKHNQNPDLPDLVTQIPVEDTLKAELELTKYLSKRKIAGKFGLFRLTSSDLKYISNYKNSFDPCFDRQYAKKIIKLIR